MSHNERVPYAPATNGPKPSLNVIPSRSTTKYLMWLAMCVWSAILTGFIVHLSTRPGVPASVTDWKASVDSLKKHDKVAIAKIAELIAIRQKDSLKLQQIEVALNNLPNKLKQIQTKYEKETIRVAALSVDDKLSLFAKRLSEKDSTGK